MNNFVRIKVTSRSFSRHPILKEELITIFPNCVFNPDGPETGLQNLEYFLSDADGLILGLENIDRSIMEKNKNLKIIAKYGVGLDNIDLKAAEEFGIKIGWTGGVNKRSVSEQTLGFILGLNRNLFQSSNDLKSGLWNKQGGAQLTQKCIGIIGCGNIGSDLVKLLQPFDVKILINDLVEKKELIKTYQCEQVDLKKLLKESDIISLHTPLTEKTYHLVDSMFLNSMKNNAFLINTSRGKVVDQKALKNALMKKIIFGAALDVFESEPPVDLEFLGLPNLVVTPHIGGNAEEAVLGMGRSAISHLRNYFLND